MQVITITPLPVLRDGISFRFTGQLEDANGEPQSEFVDIELVVPPLNLDSLRSMQGRLATLSTEGKLEDMETMVDALCLALKRNYRGVPKWLIEQTLDVGNMPDMTQAFMDVGGMKRKEVEAGKAAAAAATQTGTPSTAT